MERKLLSWAITAASILVVAPTAESSDVVVMNGLDVLSLQVNVHIEDSVAATHLALLVRNPTNVSREASLTLPLSPNAVLTSLVLTTHNETLVGVVTQRTVAAATYEAAKQRGEDAVLLDSAGKGLLSLRLNTAPGATVRLDAVYAEIVPLELGVREYVFPSSRLEAAFRSVDHYRVNVTVGSAVPWSLIEGTGVPSLIDAPSNRSATWVYDAEDATVSQDVVLRITPILSEYASSMLLSGRHDEGVFTATILPPGIGEALPVDVVFVLDHSGSMSGSKMEQAKAALNTILGQLRVQDRFGVVVFDDSVEKYRSSLLAVSGGNIDAAQDWVRGVEAEGSTNIEGGLSAALQTLGGHERAALPMIVLITDGLPTAGITHHQSIIDSVDGKNGLGARVHVVGIGFDKDNAFLGELAASQRGFYRPLDPDGDVASALEGFYAQIASPLLKDISIEFIGLEAHDVHPTPLPDLYRGSELVVAGRANMSALPATVKVVLRGQSSSGAFSREIVLDGATMAIRPEVEKLWARQKANSLERFITLHPNENVSAQRAELLAHGLRYQVETLETSWVIVPIGEDANVTTQPFRNTRSALDDGYYAPGGASIARDAASGTWPASAPPGAPPAGPPAAPAPSLVTRTPGPGVVLVVAAILVTAVVGSHRRAGQ